MEEEITLEKIELVKDRTGASYKEAREALEFTRGNVVDAIIYIEETIDEKYEKRNKMSIQGIIDTVKDLIKRGNVSRIKVYRNDEVIINVPVNAGVAGVVLFPWGMLTAALAAGISGCRVEIVKKDGSVYDVNEKAGDVVNIVKDKSGVVFDELKDKGSDIYDAAREKGGEFYAAAKDRVDDFIASRKDKQGESCEGCQEPEENGEESCDPCEGPASEAPAAEPETPVDCVRIEFNDTDDSACEAPEDKEAAGSEAEETADEAEVALEDFTQLLEDFGKEE